MSELLRCTVLKTNSSMLRVSASRSGVIGTRVKVPEMCKDGDRLTLICITPSNRVENAWKEMNPAC